MSDDAQQQQEQHQQQGQQRRGGPSSGALSLAAYASLGAGAIHAAAIGVHSEHRHAVLAFVFVAAFQLVWGVSALHNPSRALAGIGAAGNLVCLGGWVLAKTIGISFIAGLDHAERVQFADGFAAALAAVSVMCCLRVLVQPSTTANHRRVIAAVPALLIAAMTVPAMASAGQHVHTDSTAAVHEHGAVETSGAAEASTVTVVDGSPAAAARAGSAGATHDPATHDPLTHDPATHDHGGSTVESTSGESTIESATVVGAVANTSGQPSPTAHQHEPQQTLPSSSHWPRSWDPTQPLDLSGVAGVTPQEQTRAAALVEATLADLPKYADTKAAIADGYVSIGDAGTGTEHFIKSSLVEDGDMLDPLAPESLVYDVEGDQRILAGAMYIASTRPVSDPSLTAFAGPLMQWHIHDNLCWGKDDTGKNVVVGIVDSNGNCARGIRAGGGNPMVHVWIVPRACGVFSALEGIGAGSAAVPDAQRVDECTATH